MHTDDAVAGLYAWSFSWFTCPPPLNAVSWPFNSLKPVAFLCTDCLHPCLHACMQLHVLLSMRVCLQVDAIVTCSSACRTHKTQTRSSVRWRSGQWAASASTRSQSTCATLCSDASRSVVHGSASCSSHACARLLQLRVPMTPHNPAAGILDEVTNRPVSAVGLHVVSSSTSCQWRSREPSWLTWTTSACDAARLQALGPAHSNRCDVSC